MCVSRTLRVGTDSVAGRQDMTSPKSVMAIALVLLAVASANAQDAVGTVRGVARTEENGAPIPFALVRLLPNGPANATGRQSITNAQGRFQFGGVPAGAYRLQLLRIGYRPVLSPVIEVRAGEASDHEIRASMIALPLPAVIVYGEGTCLTGERVAADPYLSTLWDEVRKGVEIRRAFDRRYRYQRVFRQRERDPRAVAAAAPTPTG